jgi:predicted transcriptional regulator
MMDAKGLLSDELLYRVEKTARVQNRLPAQVVADAVAKYLEEQSWRQYVERNELRAPAKGIVEDGVDRLIHEVRRENGR